MEEKDYDVGTFFITDLNGIENDFGWKYVISFVFFREEEQDLIEKNVIAVVRNVLQEADKLKVRSVSFQSLTMGFRFLDSDISDRLLVMAIKDFLKRNPETGLKTINIILSDEDEPEPFQKELDRLKKSILILDGQG